MGEKIAEGLTDGYKTVITDISDFLGFDDQSIGTVRKKMVDLAKETNEEKTKNITERYNSIEAIKKSLNQYNGYIRKINSEDGIVDQETIDGLEEYLNELKGTNSVLNEYIQKSRAAAEATASNGEKIKYEELSADDIARSQIESIEELYYGKGIRATIDQYRALGQESGKITDAQKEMAKGLKSVDVGLAEFLEKNPSATIGKYVRLQAAATLKTIGLTAATTAFNAALSFGLSVALNAVIAGVTAWIRKYDDLREANKEIVDQFKQTSDSIQEQIDKIKEYKKVLADQNSTETEAYDARSGLIDVQKELIDTYGEEAKKLDLVNGKREEEIKKLEELERKKAKTAYDDTFGSYEDSKKKLGKKRKDNFWGNYSIGTDGEIIGNYYQRIRIDDQDLNKKIEALGFVNNGYSIRFADKVTDTEAIDKFHQLISLIDESTVLSKEIKDKFRSAISDKISKIDTDDYQALLTDVENTSWLAIRKDEKLYSKYSEIENAIKEYDEAIASNDKSGAKTALDTIEKLRNEIENMEFDDQYIKQHFIDAIDEVQHDLNKRSLKVKIETVYNEGKRNETSYLNNFKQVFDGYSDLDVQNIPLTNSTEEEKKAYKELQAFADQYKLSIEDVISILVDLGVLHSRDAEAAKYTTTTYVSMLEEVDKLTEGLDKFDSAQEKIISGSALTADELNELIKLYPELVSNVERTSKGYTVGAEELAEARAKYVKAQKESIKSDITDSERQLKNIQYELATNQAIVDQLTEKAKQGTLTAEEKRQLNNAKDIVEERLEDEKDTTTQLEQQKLLLEQIISPLEDYASMFDSVADKAKNITDKIAQMKANQAKTGTLSPSDILDFINEVPDWQNYIDLNDGQATFKDVSDEAFKEQIKETSGYNALFKDLNDKIKERDELQKKIDSFSVGSPGDAKILSDMNWELGLLNDTIDISTEELEELGKVLDRYFGTNEKISALTYLENDLAKLNHRKSLGMSDDEYSKEYYDITSQYYNDIQAAANEGDTDALSKLWEIDEQRYQNNIDGLQRNFDDAKLIIDNAREDLQISALEYQKQFAALNEQYYAPGTMLGNTEDGKKQYEANLREIEKLAGDAFSDITSRIQSSIDFGKIIDPSIIDDIKEVFEGQELPDAVAQSIQKGIETGVWDATDLAAMAPYLSEALLGNSEQLTGALQDALEQQKSYVTSAFEYEKEQLDNQLEAGLISSDDYIDEYTKLWEKYYKDKKEFAKEDLQTQKDILEAYESEIQKQIDGLDAMSELQTQPYQDEIDALNDVQDEYDKMMDKRIKALNKEKEKLEEQNKEREKANDIQDKYLAMQKASVKKYIVLTNHGWEAQADSEEYKQAKKEYEDAKQDSVTDAIEKQIDALEKEKEARDESIQTEIEEREKQIKQIETPINNLTRVLTALLAQQYNLDPDFIAQLLSSADGTTALEALNKKMSFSQSQASAAGVDVPDDTLTTSDAQRMVDELAEENNRTTEEAAKNIGLDLNNSNSTAAETTKSSDITAPQDDVVTANTQATEALTEEMKKSNDNAEKQNADSKTDDNKAKDITVGGYNLVADPKTGKLTKKPVTINGEPVEGLGHKVNATTKAEHNKHKSDYQKALESGTFTGSFADYMRQQRARKKGIVPITEATGGEAKIVAQAIQAFTGSANIPVNSNIKTNQLIEPADVVQVNTQPAFNCTINIEGSADKKTISAIENKLDERFIEYTDALNKSINLAYNKQKGKR